MSQEEYDAYLYKHARASYEAVSQHTCLLPDVGIDESLLKFSGMNSNTALQAYSDELVNSVPELVNNLGAIFGAMTTVPNAVGLVALVISMLMEILIKSSTPTSDDSYSMFRRVFGEEKASGVRDTMSESVKRCRSFMNNDQRLLEEIRRLEVQLSNDLTILRNSLLHDGQMSSRGFKIWVNGAHFHLQMMIHEARLNIQAGKKASDYVYSIKLITDMYLRELKPLLKEYKTYMIQNTKVWRTVKSCIHGREGPSCVYTYYIGIKRTEVNCEKPRDVYADVPNDNNLIKKYIDLVFAEYEPISSLSNHFLNIKSNINSLVNQNDSFTLPYGRI